MTVGLGLHFPNFPKGPCTQTVYTVAPRYLYRDYFKAKVYTTIWVRGPLGMSCLGQLFSACHERKTSGRTWYAKSAQATDEHFMGEGSY